MKKYTLAVIGLLMMGVLFVFSQGRSPIEIRRGGGAGGGAGNTVTGAYFFNSQQFNLDDTNVSFKNGGNVTNLTLQGTTTNAGNLKVGADTFAAGNIYITNGLYAHAGLALRDLQPGGDYVGIGVPSILPGTYAFVLPSTNGLVGQAMVLGGSSLLHWENVAMAMDSNTFNPNQFTRDGPSNTVSIESGSLLTNPVIRDINVYSGSGTQQHLRVASGIFPNIANPNIFVYSTNPAPSFAGATITLMTAHNPNGDASLANEVIGTLNMVGSQGAGIPHTLPTIQFKGTMVDSTFAKLDLIINAALAMTISFQKVQVPATTLLEALGDTKIGGDLYVTNQFTNFGGMFTRGDLTMTKDQANPNITMNSYGGAGNPFLLSLKTGGTEAAITNTANQDIFKLSAYGTDGISAAGGMDLTVKVIGETRATDAETLVVMAIGSSNEFGFTRLPVLSLRPFATTNHADLRVLSNIYVSQDIFLLDDDASDYVELASSAATTSYTITFPATNGLSGQTLLNDGNGFLSWATAGEIGGGVTSSFRFDPTQFGITSVTNVTLTNGVRVTNMQTYASVVNNGMTTNLQDAWHSGDVNIGVEGGTGMGFMSKYASASGSQPFIILHRTRGTLATPSPVNSGDQLGSFSIYGQGDTGIRGGFNLSAVAVGGFSDSDAETLVTLTIGSSNNTLQVPIISFRPFAITNHANIYANSNIFVARNVVLQDNDGSESMYLRAAATIGSSYVLQFPPDIGSAGQVMTNDGSGVLNWWTVPTVGGSITGAYAFNTAQFGTVNATNVSIKAAPMITNILAHQSEAGGVALTILPQIGAAANLFNVVNTNFGVVISITSNHVFQASNIINSGWAIFNGSITNNGLVFTNSGNFYNAGSVTFEGEGFQYDAALNIIRYGALSELQWFPGTIAGGNALVFDWVGNGGGKIYRTLLQSLTSALTNRLESWETNALDIGFDLTRGAWNVSPGFVAGVTPGGYVRPLVIDRVMETSQWTNTIAFASPKTTIPFNTNSFVYLNATANSGFNTTNRDIVKAGVVTKDIYIRASGGDWTFTNNANWKTYGNSTFTIPNGKIGRLTLTLHGTAESDVEAVFKVQDEVAAGGGGITNSYIFNGNQFSVLNQTNVTIRHSPFLTNPISYDGSFSAISENGITVDFLSQTYRNNSFTHGALTIQRARGTTAAPLASDGGDSIGDIFIQGHGDSTWKGGMWIVATAVSDFTDSNAESLAVISIGRSNSSVNVPALSIRGHVVTNHLDLRVNSNLFVREELRLEDNDGSASVMFSAAGTMSASYDLVWPAAQATVAGQILTNDASGNLGWWTIVGGGGGGITNSYTFHGDHFTVINETNVSIKIGPIISNVVVRAQDIDDLPLQVVSRAGSRTNSFAVSWTNGLTHTFIVTSNGITVASNLVAQNNITVSNALLLVNDAGSSNITIQAPATFASYSLTLPTTNGSANTILANNGSGTLFWKADDNSGGGGGGGLLMNADQFATNTTTAWIKDQALLTNIIVRGSTTGTNLVVLMRTANGRNPFQVQFTNGNPVFTVASNGVAIASNMTVLNDLTVNDTLVLPDDDASVSLTIQSAGTMSGNYTFTFPPGSGNSGQVMTNNGSDTMGWWTPNDFQVTTNWNITWRTNALTSAAIIAVGFNTNAHVVTLTSDARFITTNRLINKMIEMTVLVKAGTTNRNIMFDDSTIMMAGSRTNLLGSNKVAILTFRQYSTSPSDVLTSYAPQQ